MDIERVVRQESEKSQEGRSVRRVQEQVEQMRRELSEQAENYSEIRVKLMELELEHEKHSSWVKNYDASMATANCKMDGLRKDIEKCKGVIMHTYHSAQQGLGGRRAGSQRGGVRGGQQGWRR